MNGFFEIWDLIVRSNTFNFVLLVVIFCFVFEKIKITNIIDNLRQRIVDSIENAKNNKNLADTKLSKAKESVKNLDEDINSQLTQAKTTADSIAETVNKNTEKQIELINENVNKTITTEEKTISAKLTEKAASAAIAVAQFHILNTLKNRPDLQNKYIAESIQELDRIQL